MSPPTQVPHAPAGLRTTPTTRRPARRLVAIAGTGDGRSGTTHSVAEDPARARPFAESRARRSVFCGHRSKDGRVHQDAVSGSTPRGA